MSERDARCTRKGSLAYARGSYGQIASIRPVSAPEPPQLHIDVLIFGGGIAGLWTLARLRKEGYSCLLLESNALGSGQTIASQGIIHGGIKYALTGQVSAASKAIAEMPAIWKACLDGTGEIDLRGVKVLSDRQYLWTTGGIGSRIAGFAASKVIRTAVQSIDSADRPPCFAGAPDGVQVYSVDEPILDPRSLIQSLASQADAPILLVPGEEQAIVESDGSGVTLRGVDGRELLCVPKRIVLTAAEKNARLLDLLLVGEEARPAHRKTYVQQLRPLHMVMVRGYLPDLFGHCIGMSDKPRITVTSARTGSESTVWYIGGQLAETGVLRSSSMQIERAALELRACVPWIRMDGLRWSSFKIVRAEGPPTPGGRRPDEPLLGRRAHVITAFPTKLAFAPLLAERILRAFKLDGVTPSGPGDFGVVDTWPRPEVAPLPWDREDLTWT